MRVSTKQHSPSGYYSRHARLTVLAQQTMALLPGILVFSPHLVASDSEALSYDQVAVLDPADCPRFTLSSDPKLCGTHVKVVNQDTLDAAIDLGECLAKPAAVSTESEQPDLSQRVAILNCTVPKKPGGDGKFGTYGDEEELWYRSSLPLSLTRGPDGWENDEAVYSRDVLILRSSVKTGHELLVPKAPVTQLPVVSVITVAAIRDPPLRTMVGTPDGSKPARDVYCRPSDHDTVKLIMRLTLRIAAHNQHELLVLGALGCGVFGNPPYDVAQSWNEVLDEQEFQGGWWREIVSRCRRVLTSYTVRDINRMGSYLCSNTPLRKINVWIMNLVSTPTPKIRILDLVPLVTNVCHE